MNSTPGLNSYSIPAPVKGRVFAGTPALIRGWIVSSQPDYYTLVCRPRTGFSGCLKCSIDGVVGTLFTRLHLRSFEYLTLSRDDCEGSYVCHTPIHRPKPDILSCLDRPRDDCEGNLRLLCARHPLKVWLFAMPD
jgi:hypothetical protein